MLPNRAGRILWSNQNRATLRSKFDNGLSLLTYAMDDDLQDWETYAKTRVPATYSDFIELAQQLMGHSQKEKLRQIINFKFKRHSRYNWSNERLGVVEKLLQKRVQFVLHIV